MKNTEANLQALFEMVVDRGREEGISTEQDFHDLVDEVVSEQEEEQGWYEQEEASEIGTQLRSRFAQYQEALDLTSTADEIPEPE